MPPSRPSTDATSGLVAYRAVMALIRPSGDGAAEDIDAEFEDLSAIARALNPAVSRDALGWGLEAWVAQWLPRVGGWEERDEEHSPTVRKYAVHAEDVLRASSFERASDPRDRRALPFRAYGSWIGARTSGRDALVDAAARLAREAAREELHVANRGDLFRAPTDGGRPDLTSINRVMLASALDPLAFTRRAGEVEIV